MAGNLQFLEILGLLDNENKLLLPFMNERTSAGFPSPAEDHLEARIDLNTELIRHPDYTFLARNGIDADSMIDAGIFPNSLLLIDRALETRNGHIIVARLEDKFCVKRLQIVGDKIFLLSENENYQPIKVETDDFEVWGRVTYAITAL